MEELLNRLERTGRITDSDAASWTEIASLLRIVSVMTGEGATTVIKADGERDHDRYTVIVSGGALQPHSYRGDGASLEQLLKDAIRFYDERVWRGGTP